MYHRPTPSIGWGWDTSDTRFLSRRFVGLFFGKPDPKFLHLCASGIMNFSSPVKRNRTDHYENYDIIAEACTPKRELAHNVYKVPINALAGLSDDVRNLFPTQGTVVVKKCAIDAYRYEVEKMRMFSSVAPTLYMNFIHGSNCYIVMEEVPGQTLAQWLAHGNNLPPVACHALVDTLVEAGCHHHDLNFGNIMIHDGALRVIDFGPIPYKHAITRIEPTVEAKKMAKTSMIEDIRQRWLAVLVARANEDAQSATGNRDTDDAEDIDEESSSDAECEDDPTDLEQDAMYATPTLLFAAPGNRNDGFDEFFKLFQFCKTATVSTRDMLYMYNKWCRDNRQPRFAVKRIAVHALRMAANNRGYGYDEDKKLFTGCSHEQHIPKLGQQLVPTHPKRVSYKRTRNVPGTRKRRTPEPNTYDHDGKENTMT